MMGTFIFFIQIQEESEQGRIDFATVEVTVMQANNFDPVISASSTIGYILENSRRETMVSETLALDSLLKLTFSDQDVVRGIHLEMILKTNIFFWGGVGGGLGGMSFKDISFGSDDL